MTIVISSGVVRYPPEQRAKSREKILNAAADLFRGRGIAATGVDRVMERAGLTAGAFYAHFASKDALVTEMIDVAAERSRARWYGRLEHLSGRAFARAFVSMYLSAGHRRDRAGGCILPSLGPELAHSSAASRRRFERRLRGIVASFQARIAGELGAERETLLAAIALCAGALVLARAVVDAELAAEILQAAERGALSLLGADATSPSERTACRT